MNSKKTKFSTLVTALFLISSHHLMAQFGAEINVSDLDGSNGFVIHGESAISLLGSSAGSKGDINGDGINDVIMGAAFVNKAYVVFGNQQGFATPFSLSSLDGTNGFIINGENAGDALGTSVSMAGDVNNDGIDDLIIGAPNADPNDNEGAGISYVIFGKATKFEPSLSVTSLDGSNGFKIVGEKVGDTAGRAVGFAGDINDDGIDDIIIGADNADTLNNPGAGISYVVFGSNNPFLSTIQLSSLNGNNGFLIEGVSEDDASGGVVGTAGDVNFDGIDDLLIGADLADSNGLVDNGVTYVVYGSSQPFSETFRLFDLNGQNGFSLNGLDDGDNSGISASASNDVNGDGIGDLVIGADSADLFTNDQSGKGFIVFGSNNGFPSSISLPSSFSASGTVFEGVESGDRLGRGAGSAGDVNGDGFADVILGARRASVAGSGRPGKSYVFFGGDSPFHFLENLRDLDGEKGFVINGESDFSSTGIVTKTAGDINADGIDDLMVGASANDFNGTSSGSVYFIYGIEKPIFRDGFEQLEN